MHSSAWRERGHWRPFSWSPRNIAATPARRFRSVYLDTGQSGRGPRGIALSAKVFGIDRIPFGTDSGPAASVSPVIESVKQAALTPEEKQQIFVENGRRLLEAKGVTK